jgi:hypothetical protein
MPGFDIDSAKRIAQSVRYTERLQGVPSTDPNENYGAAIGGQICLVRTDATLPPGYTGAMAAPGQVVEKQPDGTINKLGAIWIKDINGGALSANTNYMARIGGTWTQGVTTNDVATNAVTTTSTTLGLYLVQMPGGSGGSISVSQFVSGKIQGASLVWQDAQGANVIFTLSNVSASSWQVTVALRYGTAFVLDATAKTARLIFYTPVVFLDHCQKIPGSGLYIASKGIYASDLIGLTAKIADYGGFNALLYDMGQPGLDPSIGAIN